MTVKTHYNEERDLAAVDQFGFIDLVESLEKGFIPEEISNTEDIYNDIEDPSTIMNKPRDVFEACRQMDNIKASSVKAAEKNSAEAE